jgi:hypothetical protein
MQVGLGLNEAKAGFERKGKALVFTTAGAETFDHEVVEAVVNELRGVESACGGDSALRVCLATPSP